MNPIDEYLEELASELKVSEKSRDRILTETEDHLRERAEREEARGVSRVAAETDAVLSFGSAKAVADDFVVEQASEAARQAMWRTTPSLLLIFAIAGVGAFHAVAPNGMNSIWHVVGVVIVWAVFCAAAWPAVAALGVMVSNRQRAVMGARSCLSVSYGALVAGLGAIGYAAYWNNAEGVSTFVVVAVAVLAALLSLKPSIDAIRIGYEARSIDRIGKAHASTALGGTKDPAEIAPELYIESVAPSARPAYIRATRLSVRSAAWLSVALTSTWLMPWSGMDGADSGEAYGSSVVFAIQAMAVGLPGFYIQHVHKLIGVPAIPMSVVRWTTLPMAVVGAASSYVICGYILARGGLTIAQLGLLGSIVTTGTVGLAEAIRSYNVARPVWLREESDALAQLSATERADYALLATGRRAVRQAYLLSMIPVTAIATLPIWLPAAQSRLLTVHFPNTSAKTNAETSAYVDPRLLLVVWVVAGGILILSNRRNFEFRDLQFIPLAIGIGLVGTAAEATIWLTRDPTPWQAVGLWVTLTLTIVSAALTARAWRKVHCARGLESPFKKPAPEPAIEPGHLA